MSARADRMALVDAGPGSPEVNVAEYRAEPSKVSIRLEPRLYYGLLDFCAEAAKLRGKRVTHVDVFRILVSDLLDNEEIRARLIGQLRGGGVQQPEAP